MPSSHKNTSSMRASLWLASVITFKKSCQNWWSIWRKSRTSLNKRKTVTACPRWSCMSFQSCQKTLRKASSAPSNQSYCTSFRVCSSVKITRADCSVLSNVSSTSSWTTRRWSWSSSHFKTSMRRSFTWFGTAQTRKKMMRLNCWRKWSVRAKSSPTSCSKNIWRSF